MVELHLEIVDNAHFVSQQRIADHFVIALINFCPVSTAFEGRNKPVLEHVILIGFNILLSF
jgi:hypothetical protein